MSYENLLLEVARLHNTSPEEVESEMKIALKQAGLNISPRDFIAITSAKAKNTLYYN
jgi:hypothetical protein